MVLGSPILRNRHICSVYSWTLSYFPPINMFKCQPIWYALIILYAGTLPVSESTHDLWVSGLFAFGVWVVRQFRVNVP